MYPEPGEWHNAIPPPWYAPNVYDDFFHGSKLRKITAFYKDYGIFRQVYQQARVMQRSKSKKFAKHSICSTLMVR